MGLILSQTFLIDYIDLESIKIHCSDPISRRREFACVRFGASFPRRVLF